MTQGDTFPGVPPEGLHKSQFPADAFRADLPDAATPGPPVETTPESPEVILHVLSDSHDSPAEGNA